MPSKRSTAMVQREMRRIAPWIRREKEALRALPLGEWKQWLLKASSPRLYPISVNQNERTARSGPRAPCTERRSEPAGLHPLPELSPEFRHTPDPVDRTIYDPTSTNRKKTLSERSFRDRWSGPCKSRHPVLVEARLVERCMFSWRDLILSVWSDTGKNDHDRRCAMATERAMRRIPGHDWTRGSAPAPRATWARASARKGAAPRALGRSGALRQRKAPPKRSAERPWSMGFVHMVLIVFHAALVMKVIIMSRVSKWRSVCGHHPTTYTTVLKSRRGPNWKNFQRISFLDTKPEKGKIPAMASPCRQHGLEGDRHFRWSLPSPHVLFTERPWITEPAPRKSRALRRRGVRWKMLQQKRPHPWPQTCIRAGSRGVGQDFLDVVLVRPMWLKK